MTDVALFLLGVATGGTATTWLLSLRALLRATHGGRDEAR